MRIRGRLQKYALCILAWKPNNEHHANLFIEHQISTLIG